MAVIRCDKGHYYDNEKYMTCPHCENGLTPMDKQEYKDDLEDMRTIASRYTNIIDDNDTTVILDFDNDNKGATIGVYPTESGNKMIVGWLVCTKGPDKGRDYRLYHGWNRVGRGLDMDVYIPDDKKVSSDSQIAVVFDDRKSKFHIVNQMGSLTYLNGKNVTETQMLTTGDIITMGDTEFVFIAFCTEERKW